MLLGGSGTRLRPLTLDTPKQVLPIVDVPMISRVLGHLEEHGVDEAVLSLGYLSEAFSELFPEHRAGAVRLRYAIEPEPLDTGGAIAFAARAAGLDEAFLVVNGDILTDLDITSMVALHAARRARATIALASVKDSSAFGLVHCDGYGRVREFVEKPPAAEAGPGLVNAGTYVFEPSVVADLPEGRRVSVEREVFPGLVAGGELFAFPSESYWTDTGTPAQYLQAQLDIVSGARPGPVAPGARPLGGGVWAVGEAQVDGRVVGPAFLGAGARVAARAEVSCSVVGAGATVGEAAPVEGSVLLPDSAVGAGATVSRSILGRGAVAGDPDLRRLQRCEVGTDARG